MCAASAPTPVGRPSHIRHPPPLDRDKAPAVATRSDLRNIGGRGAGSITAGLFLQHFAGDTPWVHLDVAGTAYSETDLVVMPKGPTGTPVRTFVEFVRR